MKKAYTGMYLVLLLLTVAVQAFGYTGAHNPGVTGWKFPAHLPVHASHHTHESGNSGIEELNELDNVHTSEVRRRSGKKTRSKFLIQNLTFRHLFKKSIVRYVAGNSALVLVKVENFYTEPYCIFRPAYYTFLFRLSPF